MTIHHDTRPARLRDDDARRIRWPVVGGIALVLVTAAMAYTALACSFGACS